MRIEIFTLCDYASINGGGLSICNVIQRIFAPKMPVGIHQFYAVARIRFDRNEEGQHEIRFTLVDDDGKQIVPPLTRSCNPQFVQDESTASVQCFFEIRQIALPHFGEYEAQLAVNGNHQMSVPVYVKPIPQAEKPL
jgi:hypothetical protein